MGFFQKLKEKWNKWFFGDYEEDEEEWDEKSLEDEKPAASRNMSPTKPRPMRPAPQITIVRIRFTQL